VFTEPKLMSKKLKWALVVAVLGTVATVAWLRCPGGSITHGRFERIQLGMTRQDAENLIGRTGSSEDEFRSWV
jgi:hypothetical protein